MDNLFDPKQSDVKLKTPIILISVQGANVNDVIAVDNDEALMKVVKSYPKCNITI